MPSVTLAATAGAATPGIGQLWTFTATVAGTDANTLPQRASKELRRRQRGGDEWQHHVARLHDAAGAMVVTVEVTMSSGETISAVTEIIIANF